MGMALGIDVSRIFVDFSRYVGGKLALNIDQNRPKTILSKSTGRAGPADSAAGGGEGEPTP